MHSKLLARKTQCRPTKEINKQQQEYKKVSVTNIKIWTTNTWLSMLMFAMGVRALATGANMILLISWNSLGRIRNGCENSDKSGALKDHGLLLLHTTYCFIKR